jgi:hypothetical protein
MIVLPPIPPGVHARREKGALHVDVRDWLSQGGRPYALLMACLRQMDGDDELVVHAPFDPEPLRDQAQRLGVASKSQELEPDHWRVTFRRER